MGKPALKSPAAARQAAPIAALDIGCSKITCLIARIDPANPARIRLLGSGRQPSRGFTGGNITDIAALERAIRLAVEDAERAAGEQISEIVLGITGPKLTSLLITAEISLGGREVIARDLRRLQAQAMTEVSQKGVDVLAAWPVAYRIDQQDGIRDPSGMYGSELGLLLSVVTAPKSVVKNLVECLGRAHLGVSALLPSAVASAAGTLIDDEFDNGAICIDMGAGVTAVSVFMHGAPAWLGLAPLGGMHVTSDIAQAFGTTFAAAERLKVQHGAASRLAPDLDERVETGRIGDDGRLRAATVERAALAAVIQPRIEETFELVEAALAKSAIRRVLPRRVVLTGGGSTLPGVRDIAEKVLKAPVRLSTPSLAEFMGESLATPAFATASGLLFYPSLGIIDVARAGIMSKEPGDKSKQSGVNTVFEWLKHNF
jgi:cell division protein FtsA